MSSTTTAPDSPAGTLASPAASATAAAAAAATARGGLLAASAGAQRRGVRSLSAAQLEKKRANDRESQRAIRERTKHQIETLERRVQELESGEAYQRLESVVREREELRAENEDIKARLTSVLAIVQPILGIGAAPNVTRHSRPDLRPPASPQTATYLPAARTPITEDSSMDSTSSGDIITTPPDERSPAMPSPPRSDTAIQTNLYSTHRQSAHHSNLGMASQSARQLHDVADFAQRQFPLKPISNANSYDQTGPLPPLDFPPRSGAVQTPAYAQTPNNILPTCHLDTILHSFAAQARQRLAGGESTLAVLGPPRPDASAFLYPEKLERDAGMETLLIKIVQSYPGFGGLSEKLCTLINLYHYMRWFISPTPEHFRSMRGFLQPIEAQIRVPHPLWVDLVIWPRMREVLVYRFVSMPLDNFFMPYTIGIRVNWPRSEPEHCLEQGNNSFEMNGIPKSQPVLVVTAELERHSDDIGNWSLDQAFAEAIPLLADTCQIRRPNL